MPFTVFSALPRFSSCSVPIVCCSWGWRITSTLPLKAEEGSPLFLVPRPDHSACQPASIQYSFPLPGIWGEMSHVSGLGSWGLVEAGVGGLDRGIEAQVSCTSDPRRMTHCFPPSGFPEQTPGHQVLLGGSPTRPPGLALDRRDPPATPAVSDCGPGWLAPLSRLLALSPRVTSVTSQRHQRDPEAFPFTCPQAESSPTPRPFSIPLLGWVSQFHLVPCTPYLCPRTVTPFSG